jgi:hypothetical protein
MPEPRKQIVIDVTDWPDELVGRAMESLARIEREARPAVTTATGWDRSTLDQFGARLAAAGASTQAKAFQRATENGGQVSRAEVYELGGFAEARSLKGFTRPVNRVVGDMKAAGVIPSDAIVPLQPVYGAGPGWKRADGFRLEPGILDAYWAA